MFLLFVSMKSQCDLWLLIFGLVNVDKKIRGSFLRCFQTLSSGTFIGDIPKKYLLYKVYMGLIKGTIPRVPPFSLWYFRLLFPYPLISTWMCPKSRCPAQNQPFIRRFHSFLRHFFFFRVKKTNYLEDIEETSRPFFPQQKKANLLLMNRRNPAPCW